MILDGIPEVLALVIAFFATLILLFSLAMLILGVLEAVCCVERERFDAIAIPTMTIGLSRSVLNLILGPRKSASRETNRLGWPIAWPLCRLALLYWVGGLTIAILFMPGGHDVIDPDQPPWQARTPAVNKGASSRQ